MDTRKAQLVRLLAVATCVAALSGCATSDSDPIAAARMLAGAPSWVAHPTGADCGADTADHTNSLPPASIDCLTAAARAGKTASAAWVEATTEGDPVPYFARANANGVLVASASAFDTDGAGGWHEYTCTDLIALTDLASCTRSDTR